jgi:hypothetical protein
MSVGDIFENRWLRRLKSRALIVYYQSTSHFQSLNGIAKELEKNLAQLSGLSTDPVHSVACFTLHSLHGMSGLRRRI